MKNKKLIITIGFIILISISLLVALNLYNKPLADIENSEADIEVTTQQLLDDYQNNEVLANEKYVDHIIQVKGEISDISVDNGNSVITFKDSSGESSVICHMLPEENLNVLKLKKGRLITVKGVCTGYLLDVIVVRCVLVTN